MISFTTWASNMARFYPLMILETLNNVRNNVIHRVPTWDPERDMPDLSGRIAIVTGGNAGLGRASVEALVKRGATVYMASRSREKAMKAIDTIKSNYPSAKLYFLHLELTSLDSVKKAAEEFLSKEAELHILLNNAGIMAFPIELTGDGLDIQWQTNHVSPFLFTKLLLPAMLRTAESSPTGMVRIINISSEAHNYALGINYDDTLCSTSIVGKWARYGQSKLANILHAKALAKRYGDKLLCISIHPGLVTTGLHVPAAKRNPIAKWLIGTTWPVGLNAEDGALTQLWASTSPELTLKDNGKYYRPFMSEYNPSPAAREEKDAEELWNYTENLLKEKGY